MTYFQQGDTLYFPIDKLPKDIKKLKNNVIQEGEATGHAHRLMKGDIFINPKTKEKYLKLITSSAIRHEEHLPISLPPGEYRVGIVREKGMFDDLIQPVVD